MVSTNNTPGDIVVADDGEELGGSTVVADEEIARVLEVEEKPSDIRLWNVVCTSKGVVCDSPAEIETNVVFEEGVVVELINANEDVVVGETVPELEEVPKPEEALELEEVRSTVSVELRSTLELSNPFVLKEAVMLLFRIELAPGIEKVLNEVVDVLLEDPPAIMDACGVLVVDPTEELPDGEMDVLVVDSPKLVEDELTLFDEVELVDSTNKIEFEEDTAIMADDELELLGVLIVVDEDEMMVELDVESVVPVGEEVRLLDGSKVVVVSIRLELKLSDTRAADDAVDEDESTDEDVPEALSSVDEVVELGKML